MNVLIRLGIVFGLCVVSASQPFAQVLEQAEQGWKDTEALFSPKNETKPLYRIKKFRQQQALVELDVATIEQLTINDQVVLPLFHQMQFQGSVVDSASVVPGVHSLLVKGTAGYAIISRTAQTQSIMINAYGEQYQLITRDGETTLVTEALPDQDPDVTDTVFSTKYASPNVFSMDGAPLVGVKNEKATFEDGTPVIDLHVLIDTKANDEFGGDATTKLAEFVIGANAALADSGANIKYQVLRVDYLKTPDLHSSAMLNELGEGESMAEYRRVAQSIGADLIALLHARPEMDSNCGIAYVGGIDNQFGELPMPSVSGLRCGIRTFAHELGHNIGLAHSRAQDDVGFSYPFALGHGEPGLFHTIMAYGSPFYLYGQPAKSLLVFSNPELTCEGSPCGIAHDDEESSDNSQSADAVRALNLVAENASGIRLRQSDDVSGLISASNPIMVEGDFPVVLDHAGDRDVFSLNLPTARKLSLSLTEAVRVTIYDSNGIAIFVDETGDVDVSLPSGDYYVAFEGKQLTQEVELEANFATLTATEQSTTEIRFVGEGAATRVVETLSGASCDVIDGGCSITTLSDMPLMLDIQTDQYTNINGFAHCDVTQAFDCLLTSGGSLTVNLALLPYQDEVGNDFPSSRLLALDTHINDGLSNPHDKDVFRFNVAGNERLRLWHFSLNRAKVTLFARDGEKLFEVSDFFSDADLEDEGYIDLPNLKPGRYYLTIAPMSEHGYEYSRYSIFLSKHKQRGKIIAEVPKNIASELMYSGSAGTYVSYSEQADSLILELSGPIGSEGSISILPVEGVLIRQTNCDSRNAERCFKTFAETTKRITYDVAEDSNTDGLPDAWQQQFPELQSALGDADEDNLPNILEWRFDTDPLNPDTDGDGMRDGIENWYRLNPTDAADGAIDSDGDFISNHDEVVLYFSNPRSAGSRVEGSDTAIAANDGFLAMATGVLHDYDGDNRADHAFYDPQSGRYYIEASGLGRNLLVETNVINGVPAPADYDGDGLTDVAVMDPAKGTWFIRNSFTALSETVWLGTRTEDIPVPADYDGDGKADPAIRRPSAGFWAIQRSSDAMRAFVYFGKQETDIPLAADMNGDGYDDFIIRRPTTGDWYVKDAVTGDITQWFLGREVGDIPFVMDYNGDGINEFAIRRPSNRNWFIKELASNDVTEIEFGQQVTDIPAIYDVDGDGRDDLVIRRPSEARFYWRPVLNYNGVDYSYFGKRDRYIPAAAPLIYRMPNVPWSMMREQQRLVEPTLHSQP